MARKSLIKGKKAGADVTNQKEKKVPQQEKNTSYKKQLKGLPKQRSAPRKKKLNEFLPELDTTMDLRITKSGGNIYNPKIHNHAGYMLAREHGFTQKQIARVFGVSHKTVRLWMDKHPDFKEKVLQGRDEFDVYHVEQMLLKRAMGFEYRERQIKTTSIKGRDADGITCFVPATETTLTTKYMPPDVKAATFWLTNRNKERWQLVHKIQATLDKTETTRTITANTADLAKMNVEQLKALRDLVSATAQADGDAIPVECISDANDPMQIEYFMDKAKEVIDCEIEEDDSYEVDKEDREDVE